MAADSTANPVFRDVENWLRHEFEGLPLDPHALRERALAAIKAQPVVSLVTALAAGYLLGRLVRR